MAVLWTSAAWAETTGNFVPHTTSILERLVSLFGIFLLIGSCWVISENRRAIDWRPVIGGVLLQMAVGLVILSPTVSQFFYDVVDKGVGKLLSFSGDGANFVFQTVEAHQLVVGSPGEIAQGQGHPELFIGRISPPVKTFAFWILPTIVFFSSLMSLLYHLGVMTFIVRGMAWLMVRTLGTSGAESLSAAANIFVGQTEAPLLVRPFLPTMTRSELMAVMVGGFATVSGGVMGIYVGFLKHIPNIAGHLVIASIMSAPAALACAKILVPETQIPATRGGVKIETERNASNFVEAAAVGASDGMKLAINVAAMLIAFVALVSMADWVISVVPLTECTDGWTTGYTCVTGEGKPLGLAAILGLLFAPLAFAMGVPFSDVFDVGQLLGQKMVLTEIIAYLSLASLTTGTTPVLTERSADIASYALCGFANFASIGIQLGGIGAMAPQRMSELAALGFKAMWAGTIAACMTGAVAGLFL